MFETPPHVAATLARHVPRTLNNVLEPAVGGGALLAPIWRRLSRRRSKLVCLDVDSKAVAIVRAEAGKQGVSCETVLQDFLTWTPPDQSPAFDCVIMNPPFSRARRLSDVSVARLSGGGDFSVPRSMPLEAAFLLHALSLLGDRGRLLAIVPCSVVMAESLQWLRRQFLASGTIEYVYEFPARTFPSVESRVYLMVFRKGPAGRLVRLRQYDAKRLRTLRLPVSGCVDRERLDFGFHDSRERLAALMLQTELDWRPLGELAHIFRGTAPSPIPDGTVVHSTSFADGHWCAPNSPPIARSPNERCIESGDLLVRRIGRASHRSFGLAAVVAGHVASDCVFVIRPKVPFVAAQLLFALRLVTSFPWAAALLERGTGARYLSKNSLECLHVPAAAADFHRDDYRAFSVACAVRCNVLGELAVSATASRLWPNQKKPGSAIAQTAVIGQSETTEVAAWCD